ncbi:hypothetical protein BJX63DRAFT_437511 [Aspergillus granulosus]|uniref:Uncharacterized protein n=1 Tax=Aspergillus granulosus TaxID=176169 RepID=A0ABR4GUU0_9EURO
MKTKRRISLFFIYCNHFKGDHLGHLDALVRGVLTSYYGGAIFSIQPDFVDQYLVWEKSNWKFLFGLPGFLSRDMLAAKNALIDTLVQYFRLSVENRGNKNFWVESVEHCLREAGLSHEEVGRVFMLHAWAILGNMFKMAFWLVAYLVQDAALLEAVTNEIQPAVKPGNNKVYMAVNHKYLTEDCPILDSIYSEVLRLSVASPLVRMSRQQV